MLDNHGASDWRLDEHHLRLLDEHVQHRRRGRLHSLLRRAVPPD